MFEPGELVRITLEGRYVGEEKPGHRQFEVRSDDGLPFELWLAAGTQARLERVAPKEWPPQIGDRWDDRTGDEWVAVGNPDNSAVNLLCVANGYVYTSEFVAEQHGPMTLVRRRGWTPDAPATVDEPDEVEERDERARYVAALRAQANFVETRTDLPVPNNGPHAQVSLFRLDDGEQAVHDAALLLGVKVEQDERPSGAMTFTATHTDPAGFEYVVYAHLSKPADPEPVVLADEMVDDAAVA